VRNQERCKTSTSSKKGAFLKPKHLYFSNENKQLVVAPFIPTSIPVFNLHETLPRYVLRDHFDEVELPDIDLYNYNEVSMAKYVPKTSPILRDFNNKPQPKAFEFQEIQDGLSSLPKTNEEVLAYTQKHNPDDLPTAVLLKLAELMR